jgi:hypothetical protein
MSEAASQNTANLPAVMQPGSVQTAGAHYVHLHQVAKLLGDVSDEQYARIVDAKTEVARHIAGLPTTTLQDVWTKLALIDEDRENGESDLTAELLQSVGRDVRGLMEKASRNGWAM